MVLLEVGDLAQARRVVRLVVGTRGWDGVEVWRDEPGAEVEEGGEEVVVVEAREVRVRGRGEERSVVCWRGEGGRWLGRVGCDGNNDEQRR